ncbi:hypothetical protein BP6252_02768 [Coleophoma cylindrospora]|uniref:Tho complex subunit 7 n=1 Tax=Coleophoma cylindrospora TaxID=1849047 RepID=A0A3D8SHE6_9HELO|nr:hypothetical protein BP6252_02768 [Coleophoma cylindrospora]
MSFQLLDTREEDELHKSRLLNVEEKPFKRITKRLLTPGSLVSTPSKLPTPPPDSTEDAEVIHNDHQKTISQYREDIILDFAAFDSSIARIQFLRNSNERERERYKADKQRILETAQDVRDSTAQLRIQLQAAKNTLEQRKKFDELTEKITNNKLLRPRQDQEINLRKLEEECKDLERESMTYSETWKERREQFGRIVEEGMQLRRLIRDEKEEVERREGMNEDDGEDNASQGGQTPKHSSQSGNATPRPDPAHNSPDTGLKPRPLPAGSLSGNGSRSNSRAPSPAGSERRRAGPEEGEDVTMTDQTPAEGHTPRVTVDESSNTGTPAAEQGEIEDKMDTT